MGPHFRDAWTPLSGLDLARMLLPPAFVLLAALLPGRAMARLSAAGVGLSLLVAPGLELPGGVRAGWTLLWLVIAWLAGRPAARPDDEEAERGRGGDRPRAGGLEGGAVGLLLAPLLLVLLLAVVAQLDLRATATRTASVGVALVSFGVLHLMVRRHLVRAAVAFASIALGLELLDAVAGAAWLAGHGPGAGGPLLAATIATGLSARLARGRERAGGTAWVGDAHDLHD
jgi:hypothetical protein